MSDRKICCEGCATEMGTIRDARLRKDIQYFCAKCVSNAADAIEQLAARVIKLEEENTNMRNAGNMRKQTGGGYSSPFADIFGDR